MRTRRKNSKAEINEMIRLGIHYRKLWIEVKLFCVHFCNRKKFKILFTCVTALALLTVPLVGSYAWLGINFFILSTVPLRVLCACVSLTIPPSCPSGCGPWMYLCAHWLQISDRRRSNWELYSVFVLKFWVVRCIQTRKSAGSVVGEASCFYNR
jgi:hypothetical protein